MTSTDLKRLILDALAEADTYDAFRTRLREKLREEKSDLAHNRADVAVAMRGVKPADVAGAIIKKSSPQ